MVKNFSVQFSVNTNHRLNSRGPSCSKADYLKAGFPLGEFIRANKQKANVIGW